MLVYPVSLQDGEELPAAHTVEGFQQDLLVLFLDVGPFARANLPAFHERLSEAAAEHSGDVASDDVLALAS